MKDPRYTKLANRLIDYSVSVKEGEQVLIHTIDIPEEMVLALVEEV